MRPYCLVFVFALWLRGFSQQLPEKRISVESIGINKGLSQGMINCIWQDHFGFLWFGTMDGLNRYDGYKFQVFRHDSFDSSSISGNFITSIYEDKKGRLWVGTALNGLNLFIPEKEQFIHFGINSKPALSNNTIYSIQEDRHGAIWIATDSGLNKLIVSDRFQKQSNFSSYALQLTSQPVFVSIRHVQLTDQTGRELFVTNPFEAVFLISKSGTIWVSASRSIYKISPLKDGSEKIVKGDSLLNSIAGKLDGNKDIIKIVQDTTNGLLCFKGKNFLVTIDEKIGKASYWNCAPFDIAMGRNQVVFDRGILYERSRYGMICFDLLQKKLYRLRSYNTESDKMMSTPFSLYKDRSGIIWIGTGGFGLIKYNPRAEYFHKVITNTVTWMSATPSGDVLIMTPEIKYFFKDKSNDAGYSGDTTFYKRVIGFTKRSPDFGLQDKEGIYWLNVNGLAKYNALTNSFQMIKTGGEPLFPYFLDNKDRLWYATPGSFCLFDKNTNTATCYQFPVTAVAASPYKFCQVIYQDAKGIFWLGTTEGLFSFKEATRQWRHYKNIPGDSTSLSNNIVFSICDDPQNPAKVLWVGTNGGGLNRLDISTGRFEYTGLKQGLPNMVVYGILSDDDKQLWLSTNRGIACLNTRYKTNLADEGGSISKNKFRYYYEENGLQSNEFNRYAYCKTKDGTLFFGGVNGFNYFKPREVISNPVMPNVVITDFKLSNKTVSFNPRSDNDKGNAVLSKPAFLSDKIILPYAYNMFSFDFATLDFTTPEKNLYEYKMHGFDKEWVQGGNSYSATYTNLDPGDYTFIVKGCNSDGVWSEKGTSIRLTILAPWYMTWWFRTAVLAAIVALVYSFFRYRLEHNLRLFKIRNNIANDLHDEIGSTLSSVYIYSEVAQRTLEDIKPQAHAYLKQISADTGNMIDALSDIVWTVNAQNDRFENIINRMRAAAVELFEAKGYVLHLQFAEQLTALKLGMADRKNFYLFYKEAINNAAKYAEGKNIWIRLTYVKPSIRLCVRDDGRGFEFSTRQAGNGLASMQRRADELKGSVEIISSPGIGTEVLLVFPHS